MPSEIIEERIKETSAIYNAGVKRIKNDKIKTVLGLDLPNYAVKRRRGNSATGKLLKGLSSFQIESAIKNQSDSNINENFDGVFPANYMNRFIDYKSLMSEKKVNIPFNSQHR